MGGQNDLPIGVHVLPIPGKSSFKACRVIMIYGSPGFLWEIHAEGINALLEKRKRLSKVNNYFLAFLLGPTAV